MSHNDFDVKRYREAMDRLHASDDTLTEVLHMVEKKETKRTARRVLRPAVVLAICALILGLGGVAYATGVLTKIQAILNPSNEVEVESFADAVYGDEEIDPSAEPVDTGKGTTHEVPEQERVEADPEVSERTIGDYTYNIDATATVGDYTYSFEQMLMDEDGRAAIYYTLSNPNGVRGYHAGNYGVIYFDWDEGDGLIDPMISTVSNHYTDDCTYLMSASSDETELHIVDYVGMFDQDYEEGDALTVTMGIWHWHDKDNEEDIRIDETDMTTITLLPEKLIPVTVLSTEDGSVGSVSPIGISLDMSQYGVPIKCIIYYKDGTEYIVESDEDNIDNSTLAWDKYGTSEDPEMDASNNQQMVSYCFNQLVDVSEIESVTFAYDDPEAGVVIEKTFTP